MPKDSFEEISDEMYTYILQFLGAGDLTKAAQVSKKWKQVSEDRQLWLRLVKEKSSYQVKKNENAKEIYKKIYDLGKKTPQELLIEANDNFALVLHTQS